MKKNQIFIPILLFFTLKNNNLIFSSFDFTKLHALSADNESYRNNSYIGDPKDFFNDSSLQTSPIQTLQSSPSASSSWVVTRETPKQKETRIKNMIQEVDHIVQNLIRNGQTLPSDFDSFLQDKNFSQYHINEMNDYLLQSKQQNLKDRALGSHLKGIEFSKNALYSLSAPNTPQHHSNPAISSSTNNQSNSNNTNHQLLSNSQKDYVINQNINEKIIPKLKAYFTQRAIEDAENAFKNRVNGGIYESQYSKHLLNFGLTIASSDKSPVDLGPIQEDINDFIRLGNYTSSNSEAFIRNNLQKRNVKDIYHKTFNSHLRELEKRLNQQSLQNNVQQTHSSQTYQEQRQNWLKSIQS